MSLRISRLPSVDECATLPADELTLRFFGELEEHDIDAEVESLAKEVLRLLRIDLAQAEAVARAAIRIAEASPSPRARGIAERALANAHYLAGRYTEAVDGYLRALAFLREADDELETAITLSSSLQAQSYLGRYAEAMSSARLARQIALRHEDLLLAARIDSNEANIHFRQDRMEEALVLYQSSLDQFGKLDSEPQDRIAVLYNIASCQIGLRRFDEALAAYRHVSELCVEHEMPLVAAQTDYNIAYLYYLRADYPRSIQLYQQARERCRASGDRYHEALSDLDLAELYLELQLSREGEQLARRACDAFEGLKVGYERMKAVVFIAVALAQQGKTLEALEQFQTAHHLGLREGNDAWLAAIDLYHAVVLHDEGRWIEGRRSAAEAAERFRRLGLSERALSSELVKASCLLRCGELESAAAGCEQALEEARELDEPRLLLRFLLLRAHLAERAGAPLEALGAFGEASSVAASARCYLRASHLQISKLVEEIAVFDGLMWNSFETAGAPEIDAERLGWIEGAKARATANRIAFRASSLPPSRISHSPLVVRMTELREELNWYHHRLVRGHYSASSSAPSLAVSERLLAARAESEGQLARALGDLATEDAALGTLQTAATADLETIRSSLPPTSLVLDYFVSRGTIYAAAISVDSLTVRPVSTDQRVRGLLRLLGLRIVGPASDALDTAEGRRSLSSAREASLRGLYRELLPPESELEGVETLIVSPDNLLWQVPFAALHDGDGYLSDRLSVIVTPSATVWSLDRRREASEYRERLALVADTPDPAARWDRNRIRTVQTEAGLDLETFFTLANGASSLHIQTQGLVQQDNPMFSSLAIGSLFLPVFEIFRLVTDAEDVVLTGCAPKLSSSRRSADLACLARACLHAGARTLVLPLWNAEPELRELWLDAYLRCRGLGSNPEEAAREARLELRELAPDTADWASFAVIQGYRGEPSREGGE